jgi:biotin transport system substrate-specific component
MARPLPPLWGGLLTSLALCACAPLSLDLGPVPVTLQSLIICLAGALERFSIKLHHTRRL